jgi:hypothetical protein
MLLPLLSHSPKIGCGFTPTAAKFVGSLRDSVLSPLFLLMDRRSVLGFQMAGLSSWRVILPKQWIVTNSIVSSIMFPVPLTLVCCTCCAPSYIWVSQWSICIGWDIIQLAMYSTWDLRSRISSLRPLLHPQYVLLHHPSLDEQSSEAMDNSCLHGLFTLPLGENVNFSLAAATVHRSR